MKEKIFELKYKTLEFINQQKILSAVIGLTLIMTIGIIALSVTQKNEKIITLPDGTTRSIGSQSESSTETTNSPQNISTNKTNNNAPKPTDWQQYTKLLIQQQQQQQPTIKAIATTINTPTLTPTPTPTTNQSGATTKWEVPLGQNTSNVTQPTTPPPAPVIFPAPDTNPTSAPSSTGPKIIFIDSNGNQQVYTPPTDPPVEITWARYTNQLEKYSIDYPSNWQIVTTQYRGHEAVFVYAPGADPSNPNVQYISYGWSSYFYPPAASYVGTFTQDNVPGTIYTNGSMGSTYIKGVFQYYNGFLVLNNNVSDEIFAYIFNHMILSLDFNIP